MRWTKRQRFHTPLRSSTKTVGATPTVTPPVLQRGNVNSGKGWRQQHVIAMSIHQTRSLLGYVHRRTSSRGKAHHAAGVAGSCFDLTLDSVHVLPREGDQAVPPAGRLDAGQSPARRRQRRQAFVLTHLEDVSCRADTQDWQCSWRLIHLGHALSDSDCQAEL